MRQLVYSDFLDKITSIVLFVMNRNFSKMLESSKKLCPGLLPKLDCEEACLTNERICTEFYIILATLMRIFSFTNKKINVKDGNKFRELYSYFKNSRSLISAAMIIINFFSFFDFIK